MGHIHLRGKWRSRTPRWYNAALTITKWMGNPSSPTLSSKCENGRACFCQTSPGIHVWGVLVPFRIVFNRSNRPRSQEGDKNLRQFSGSRYTGERHLATQRNNERNQGTLLRTFDQPRATDSRTHVDVPRSVSLFQNRMRGAESAGNSWNSSKTNGPRVLVWSVWDFHDGGTLLAMPVHVWRYFVFWFTKKVFCWTMMLPAAWQFLDSIRSWASHGQRWFLPELELPRSDCERPGAKDSASFVAMRGGWRSFGKVRWVFYFLCTLTPSLSLSLSHTHTHTRTHTGLALFFIVTHTQTHTHTHTHKNIQTHTHTQHTNTHTHWNKSSFKWYARSALPDSTGG